MSSSKKPVLVVLGDGGVGKTSIIMRYTCDKYEPKYNPTLEDMYSAKISVGEEFVDIEIADTAGQDVYKSLTSQYLDVGDIFLIVYSVMDPKTLMTAKNHLEEIKVIKENSPFKFVLVGNKCDVQNRSVTAEDGQALARQFGGSFIECSAKEGTNIDKAFSMIGELTKENDSEKVDATCHMNCLLI